MATLPPGGEEGGFLGLNYSGNPVGTECSPVGRPVGSPIRRRIGLVPSFGGPRFWATADYWPLWGRGGFPIIRDPKSESLKMTIDKSLKIKAGATKTRNVLTRAERLTKLIATERWQEGDPIYGLPKVRVQKISLKKKKKAKKDEDDDKK